MFTELRSGRTRTSPLGTAAKPVKRPSHVMPRLPVINLEGPGHLRTCHVLALCAISHSTLYNRIKASEFPAPDGQDGRLIYWHTANHTPVLDAGALGSIAGLYGAIHGHHHGDEFERGEIARS